MKKRIVLFALIVLTITCLTAVTVSAATYSGTCGDNLTWKLDTSTGVLEIDGEGEMTNWGSYKSVPWYSYNSNVKTVNIGDSVTSIGDRAFYNCDSLTSVDIGDSVTSIGSSAFYSCSSLTSVVIPDSITSIGSSAFNSCYNLTSVVVPDSITSIGNSAFLHTEYYNDNSNWDNGVLYIGNCLITAEGSLGGEYIINANTACIADYAFSSCKSLTRITVDEENIKYSSDKYGVLFNKDKTTLIQYPRGNTHTRYIIPYSVTSISDRSFYRCYNLTSITVDTANTKYSNDEYGVLFNKDKTTLIQYPAGNTRTSYTIPDSVTSIGEGAFYDCYSVTSVVIPDSVTSIGDFAFEDCYSVTSVDIGDSVTSIGDWAFAWCTSLTSVVIPDSVTSIGEGAFYDCYSLTSVVIPDSVTSIGDGTFDYCFNVIIYGYTGSYAETYANDNNIPFVALEETVAIPGDVNADGKVDRKDLNRLAQYFARWDVEIDTDASDANGDGKVDRKDLNRLAQYFARWDVELGK